MEKKDLRVNMGEDKDKRDDFDFDTVNFPFLDGDVPRRPTYGVVLSPTL